MEWMIPFWKVINLMMVSHPVVMTRCQRGDDDDDEITLSAFPAVGDFIPQNNDGAPEDKSGEPMSGGIPIDTPAPILKDVPVPRPSPDGSDSSSISRSVGSSKAIQITKVYKAQ